MAITDKSLTSRGDLKAAVGAGSTVLFVTAHPEGQPTALYRLDAAKLALTQDPLPAGGVDLVTDGDAVWVAGTDRRIYRGTVGGGELAPVGPELDDVPVTLAAVSDGKLLSTHTRAKLEPEDKGKGNNHADRVVAMRWAPAGDRLLTGAKDSAVKSWPRVGNVKPATLKDGVAKVVDLAIVTLYNWSNLVVACE